MQYKVFIPVQDEQGIIELDAVELRYEECFGLSKKLIRHGVRVYETETISAICAVLEELCCDKIEDINFLDVGANIGFYSWVVSTVFQGRVRVRAYEPFPDTAEYLRAVVVVNNLDIDVVEAAVGSKPGNEKFFISKVSDHSHSLVMNERKASGATIDVAVETIDIDSSHKLLSPSVIKIDAEGADAEVLRGAIETIRNFRPYLVVEVLNESVAVDVMSIIESGYFYYHLSENGPVRHSHLYAQGGLRNWLLSPAELSKDFCLNWNSWHERFRTAREPEVPARACLKRQGYFTDSFSLPPSGEKQIFFGSSQGLITFWSNDPNIAGSVSFVVRKGKAAANLLSGHGKRIGVSTGEITGARALDIIVEPGGWLTFRSKRTRSLDLAYTLFASF